MRALTTLGGPLVFVALIPVLRWVVSPRLAVRVALFVFIGGMLNGVAKLSLKAPRPFWVSEQVRAIGGASSGFGMPSGHAQVTAPAWGLIVARTGVRGAWLAGVLLVIGIGFSRIYLGVHSPSQVLAGLLLGGMSLWAMLRCEAPLMERFEALSLRAQVTLCVLPPLLMMVAGHLLVASSGWTTPDEWVQAFQRAAGEERSLRPLQGRGLSLAAGGWGGTALGVVLERRYIGWQRPKGWASRLLCVPVGLLVVSAPTALWAWTLGALGAGSQSGAAAAARYFGLTFILFVGVFFLAPAAFRRLWAHRTEATSEPPPSDEAPAGSSATAGGSEDDEELPAAGAPSGMYLEAHLDLPTIVELLGQATPVRLHFADPEDNARWLDIGSPTHVELREGEGVVISTSARVRYAVARFEPEIRIRSMVLLLSPRVASREGRFELQFRLAIEDADVAKLPGLVDTGIVNIVNAKLTPEKTKMTWAFQDTLSASIPLSDRLEPLAGFELRATGATATVHSDHLRLRIDFKSAFHREDASRPT